MNNHHPHHQGLTVAASNQETQQQQQQQQQQHQSSSLTMPPTSITMLDDSYHDHAHETEEESNGGQPLVPVKIKNGTNSEQNFPVKLHYVLSDLAKDGLDYIVSWQPHGRCFIVHDQNKFATDVLPLWFRQTKFTSFQRQLNLYGFKRVTEGPDKGAHYHELFLRGKRFLAHRIPRTKISGPRRKHTPSPNFYRLPYLPLHDPVPAAAGSVPSSTTSLTNNNNTKTKKKNDTKDHKESSSTPSAAYQVYASTADAANASDSPPKSVTDYLTSSASNNATSKQSRVISTDTPMPILPPLASVTDYTRYLQEQEALTNQPHQQQQLMRLPTQTSYHLHNNDHHTRGGVGGGGGAFALPSLVATDADLYAAMRQQDLLNAVLAQYTNNHRRQGGGSSSGGATENFYY